MTDTHPSVGPVHIALLDLAVMQVLLYSYNSTAQPICQVLT